MPIPDNDDANAGQQRQGVQVIARVGEILRLLKANPVGLTQAELAKDLGLARTTVHRLLNALGNEGLVQLGGSGGRYRLGLAIVQMADAARTTVVAEAHAVIQRLSDAVKETVDLSVLDRGAAVFLDQVVSAQRLRAVSSVGASFPLHCTANGKAMLAQLPPSKLEEALSDDFEAYTANTITSPGALRRELQEIRKLGVAIDREEHSHGVSAIGVCIGLTPLGYMAISIPIPTQRFEDKQALATELIGHAAAEVRSLFDA